MSTTPEREFGYRFITDELAAQGWTASRNRVNQLCTTQQLWSVHARRRGRSRRPGPPVHDDLVGRESTAAAPNLLWFTDITGHPTAKGKLYLCAVKDARSKRIAGYSTDTRMTSRLVIDAEQGHLPARAQQGRHRASRPRQPISIARLPAGSSPGAAAGVDGSGRDLRGQRGDGLVFSLLQKNVLNCRR